MAKSLIISNKRPLWPLFIISLALLGTGCKKDSVANAPAATTYLKEFGDWATQYSPNYLEQRPDGSFLVVGGEGGNRPMMLRIGKNGNLVWNKFISNDTFLLWTILPNNDGTYVVNYPNKYLISQIDTMGNVLAKNEFFKDPDNYNALGPVINGPNGNYISSMSNGAYTGATSHNYILTFNNSLKLVDSVDIKDYPLLAGKTLSFNVCQYDNLGNYYITGQKLARKVWSWSDNQYLYAAKLGPRRKWAINVIDTADVQASFQEVYQLVTKDTSLVICATRIDYSKGSYSVFVAKVDKNMNLLWANRYEEPGVSSSPYTMGFSNDSGFVITGNSTAGLNSEKPYVLRLDKNGNKLWSKTYPIPGYGQLCYAVELKEGGYAFVGNTTSFGNVKKNQTLFIKTDAQGNY